jgi:hypothetical protein
VREKADTDLGWFKVSDDLGQALARANLNGNEYAVCIWVMCRTYGVRKRIDGKYVARKFTPYTAYQIAKETGRDLSGILRTVRGLLSAERGVLRLSERGEIGFNTRLGVWGKDLVRGTGWEDGTGGRASMVDRRPPQTGVHQIVDGCPPKGGQASTTAPTRARVEGEIESKPLPLSGVEKSGDLEAYFNRAWELYPRKESRGSAFRVWRRLKPSIELAATIIVAIKAHRASAKWTEHKGRWVPKMAKWLRNEGWEDAAPATPSDAPKTRRCERCKTSPVHGDQRFCVGDCSLCSQCRDVYEDLKPVGSLYLCKNCRKEKS